MKKMKYYEETSALLHEFSEENQQYFEELWDSFNLAGFLYDEDYLGEQIYLMMLDFSEAERDGMSAEDYLGKNPKKNNERDSQGSTTQFYQGVPFDTNFCPSDITLLSSTG